MEKKNAAKNERDRRYNVSVTTTGWSKKSGRHDTTDRAVLGHSSTHCNSASA